MSDLIECRIDDREVTRTLERLARKVADLSPVMREISGVMLDAVHDNFATEGSRTGNPWKKSKRSIRDAGQTLQDTQRLYRSIQAHSDAHGAVVGTNVAYAAAHHFGVNKTVTARVAAHRRKVKSRDQKQGRKKSASGVAFVRAHSRTMKLNLPARPFLVLADDDTRRIVERMRRYLE
jgi:phage virion morphogenesis protein